MSTRPYQDRSFRIVVMTYGPTKYSIVPPNENGDFTPPYAYPAFGRGFPSAPNDRTDHLDGRMLHADTVGSILVSPSPSGWIYSQMFARTCEKAPPLRPSREILSIEHAISSLYPLLSGRLRKPTFLDAGRRGLLEATLACRRVPGSKSLLREIHTAAGLVFGGILSDAEESSARRLPPKDTMVVLPRLGAEAFLNQATGRNIEAPPDRCVVILGSHQKWTLDTHPSFAWNLSGP